MVSPGVAPVTVQEEALRMNRGGGLHPPRPNMWTQTKRPRAALGELNAASVRNVSCQEGVPTCLRTSPPLGGALGVHWTP